MPGAEAGQRVLDALPGLDVPSSCCGPTRTRSDPAETGRRFAAAIGAPEPEFIENASHFLQEDAGEEIRSAR
jgi:pimeloyl-ACP methyl ester carboxylesterase